MNACRAANVDDGRLMPRCRANQHGKTTQRSCMSAGFQISCCLVVWCLRMTHRLVSTSTGWSHAASFELPLGTIALIVASLTTFIAGPWQV